MFETVDIPDGQNGFVIPLRDSGGHSACHRHAELEFNLVTSGSGYYVVGSQRHFLTGGTLIWLFPGQEHLLVDYSDSFCMWVVVFTDEVREQLAGCPEREQMLIDDPGRVLIRRLSTEDSRRLDELSRSVHFSTGHPDRFNLGIAYLAAESWNAFLHGHALESGTDLSPVVVGALRMIAKSGGCISLTELADALNTTPSWISRCLHREMTVPFTALCNQTRLMKFRELRRLHPGTTLTKLAYRAGFGSYAQFHRVFREAYGVPPSGEVTLPVEADGEQ